MTAHRSVKAMVVLGLMILSAASVRPAEKVAPAITIRAHPFALRQVRLLDGPFREAMERDRKYLHSLDTDRLLHMFRVTAGLRSSSKPYGGWEKPDVELRGHSIGHYLSACALMYASTGDQALKAQASKVVAELAKCQISLGRSGYLSAFPEEFFDRVETGKKVWAPWYTLHKIYAGLIDMYEFCDSVQALKVAVGMAQWARQRTGRLDEAQMQKMLDVEHGGMNDALRHLYAVTGEADLLALARRFDHRALLDPLAHRQDRLKGLHVNTQIPKVIGAARGYELTGEPYFYDVATYFWNEVTGARCYATGGTSNDEHWRTEPYQLASELGRESHETCCTYNMLKLTRHLFTWQPDPAYADYYERALFNGILATQDPGNGMMMYYVPMAPGYYKTFMQPEDSFWCCTGTGMENHAKYGDSIYFYDDGGLFVNLFIASELDWSERGIRIRQETRFPEEARTTFVVKSAKPANFTLRVRIPEWIASGAQATLNGRRLDVFSSPSSYLAVTRTWHDGDTLAVDLPMKLHLERLPDDADTVAIMYGPLVLAGQLGSEGLTADTVYGPMGPSGDPAPVPQLAGDRLRPDSWVKQVPGRALTFQSVGAGRPADVTLIPFYKMFGRRYTVYWKMTQ
jgi:hypothetical protein